MAYVFGSIWDRLNRNALNALSKSVEQQGKSIQDLVAEGQLTLEQYAELIKIINSLVKSGEVGKFDLTSELREELNKIPNKINKGEVTERDITGTLQSLVNSIPNKIDKGNVSINDLSPEILDAINNSDGTPFEILSIPRDGSVTGRKMDGVDTRSTTVNIFNHKEIITGGYYEYNRDGEWRPHEMFNSSDFIQVKPDTLYQKNNETAYCLWDRNRNFISGITGRNISTTSETVYITFAIDKGEESEIMLTESSVFPSEYAPFSPKYTFTDKWEIPSELMEIKDNSVKGTALDDVTQISVSGNLFNKDDVIVGYGEPNNNGEWRAHTQYVSPNFIPIKPNIRYRKNIVANYCFWDVNKEFISGGTGVNLTAPEGSVYVTFAIPIEEIESAQLMIASDWVDEYTPYKQGYLLGEKWVYDKEIQNQNQIKDLFLRVPTPYHDGSSDEWNVHQTTHPSIVQFENGWNGYKYWMCHTPYPHENNRLENPCIAVSNNGIKWEEPEGVVNPLVDAPASPDYNSDGHIFYNSETAKLEIWYREVVRSITPRVENIRRITSSDGVNWSALETMYSHQPSEEKDMRNILSPTVIRDSGKYKMWYSDDYHVKYMESVDGKEWSVPELVLSNGNVILSWHLDIILHEGKYHMLNLEHDVMRIRYSHSEPGNETDFSEETVIIESSQNEWELDGKWLYRASTIFKENSIIVIYGTVSQQNDWLLHAKTGNDFYNLKPITERAFRFYGVE